MKPALRVRVVSCTLALFQLRGIAHGATCDCVYSFRVFALIDQGQDPEKFFVSAGFALTHPTSVTDITAIEAVRVEELDEAAVSYCRPHS